MSYIHIESLRKYLFWMLHWCVTQIVVID